ncbi:hypothetical protein SAMN05216244_3601 [Sediminibacillus halophilus]|uniref:Uncharacterized protein n=1 Tax=Sediminibacillus halophilus TaxID=482461 RepID=A0A1G9WRN1_9BACI|nr:hypothetical protein SAMN05216244_3601 [Sediminibacillus halophilus]
MRSGAGYRIFGTYWPGVKDTPGLFYDHLIEEHEYVSHIKGYKENNRRQYPL